MADFDTSSTVGDIVVARPAAADVFERLGIDFCCGGSKSLAEAAAERELDAATVLVMIDSLAATPAGAGHAAHDVGDLSVGDLADHIVAAHHDPLRNQLVKIDDLLDTVVRVHGADDPNLAVLRANFLGLRDELAEHMTLEEEQLFPACRALDADPTAGPGDDLLVGLGHTHEDTGAKLADLRALAGDYKLDAARCGTHRLLLQTMTDFEADLHQHIHEENNVLFPRTRELAGGTATPA